MSAVIDLKSELLIDRSRIGNPYLQLLLAVRGKELFKGSAWVAINKKVASQAEYDGSSTTELLTMGA